MNFQKVLSDFESYHRSLGNRLCHYIGISLITLSSLGLLYGYSLGPINLALALLLITLILDLIICPSYALAVLLVGGLFLTVSLAFNSIQLLVLFLVGWAFQLLGHRYAEGNKPAFLKNMLHLYVGPRWMLLQWLTMLGFPPRYAHHMQLNTDIPDLIRCLLARLIPWAGDWARREIETSMSIQIQTQRRLRTQVLSVEISTYTEELRERIKGIQASLPGSVFIYTSGSTSKPKQIVYNKERLRIFKKTSLLSALQSFQLLQAKPSMFVFSSLQKDDSFASLVVSQKPGLPKLLTGIIEPAKFLFHPHLQELIKVYGANATRLWLITMSDPSLLYATNPSTLAVFLRDVADNWPSFQRIFIDFQGAKGGFTNLLGNRSWLRLVARLGHGSYGDRICKLASASSMPPFSIIAPSLKGYVCWDGGYVTGFLKTITTYLPPAAYRHIPMFSMSTETLQTQMYIKDNQPYFIPLAPYVLYEFLPEDQNPRVENLLLSDELVTGQSYIMIVSDKWGLRRYNTQDVFLCRKKLGQLPDLAFVRRQGLNFSFTGEKLTAEQVTEALELWIQAIPGLASLAVQYSLIPSQPKDELPHYVLLAALVSKPTISIDQGELASKFDSILAHLNQEYRDKRQSQRLGSIRIFSEDYDRVARHLDPKTHSSTDVQNRSWESQFKLAPLTPKLWQSIGLE